MRCKCCNAQFEPQVYTLPSGKIHFEELCWNCIQGAYSAHTYTSDKEWEHSELTDKVIQVGSTRENNN